MNDSSPYTAPEDPDGLWASHELTELVAERGRVAKPRYRSRSLWGAAMMGLGALLIAAGVVLQGLGFDLPPESIAAVGALITAGLALLGWGLREAIGGLK